MATLNSGGKILSRVSGDVGDANTSYYYFACNDFDEKNFKSLEWVITATTLTLEFTNEDLPAGTNPFSATSTQLAALNWKDLTSTLTGAATQTSSGSFSNNQDFKWKLGRVKLVTTNAINACSLYLHRG